MKVEMLEASEVCNGSTSSSQVFKRNGRLLKLFKFVGINLLVFGLELCASAGFTYIPPIMLKKGFSESALTIVLGIGPCISFVTVPVVGRWSDKCNSRYGRRRPFILVFSLLILFSLLMIPFSKEIAMYLYGSIHDTVVLLFGVIALDFSTQALMNPCKALIPDIYPSLIDQNLGFTVYSFMLALGGCAGYLISCISWNDTVLGETFGGQEKVVFFLLAITFFALMLVNLNIAKEIPLSKNALICNDPTSECHSIMYVTNKINGFCMTENDSESVPMHLNIPEYHNVGIPVKRSVLHFLKCACLIQCIQVSANHFRCCFTLFFKLYFKLKTYIFRFFDMPPLLMNLFVSSLFGWMGIMCHDLYYTDFVGQVIYQGNPAAINESLSLDLYNQGVRMGSWGLLLHCLSAAVYSGLIHQKFATRYGLRNTYISGITLFALSLFGTVLTNSLIIVNIFSALSGIGYSALSTVPYTLVTFIHSSEEKTYEKKEDRGIGEDMAVLDSAFSLAQIIPSFFLGFIVDFFGTPAVYMVIAAFCGAAASYSALYIQFPVKNAILMQ